MPNPGEKRHDNDRNSDIPTHVERLSVNNVVIVTRIEETNAQPYCRVAFPIGSIRLMRPQDAKLECVSFEFVESNCSSLIADNLFEEKIWVIRKKTLFRCDMK